MVDIKKLVQIHHKEIKEDTIIHYPQIWYLCSRPYPNHPKGCPNVEKCRSKNIPSFEIINKCGDYKHYYLIYGIFDRKGYREVIGKNDNMRWWQKSVKNLLRDFIEELQLSKISSYVFTSGSGTKFTFQYAPSMEYCCINVFSTMRLNGIKLDLNPRDKVILCNLLCSIEKINFNNNRQKNLEGFLDA